MLSLLVVLRDSVEMSKFRDARRVCLHESHVSVSHWESTMASTPPHRLFFPYYEGNGYLMKVRLIDPIYIFIF